MSDVTGNLGGLAAAQLKSLKRIYNRKIDSDEIVSLDLARELLIVAEHVKRRVGVLISREGLIEEVFVGTRELLYLPDLGRYRYGKNRLRRLRLIYTDLSKGDEIKIPSDIFADLEKLRLDMVCAIKDVGKNTAIQYATISPTGHTLHDPQILDHSHLESFETLISEVEDSLTQVFSSNAVLEPNGALLVGIYEKSNRNWESSFAELKELCRSSGIKILGEVTQRRDIDPKTLLGKGKLLEVVLTALRMGSELVIFDGELRPAQWRNITNTTELKILDRSMVILDIFAQRASSSEGRLQVELAQLKYNLPRLSEQDSGLSRLTGGIGGRGPGETKLEISRRRTRDKINFLEKKLVELKKQRTLRKKKRIESTIPVIAFIGYTNVGKSTLFNLVTKSSVLAEDKLFATLEVTQRKVFLPTREGSQVEQLIFSDTVGFIRDLPKELQSAFLATLEELGDADLFVHVLDAADHHHEAHYKAVRKTIETLGFQNTPELCVLNKVDLIDAEVKEILENKFTAISVSALKNENVRELVGEIQKVLGELSEVVTVPKKEIQ